MNKGFTLIEVISVIVIISILLIFTIPSVIESIEEARERKYNEIISNIEQTTQLYIRNNKDSIEGIDVLNNTIQITIEDLVINEGLKTPIINPINDTEISQDTTINIVVKPRYNYDVTVGEIIYVE